MNLVKYEINSNYKRYRKVNENWRDCVLYWRWPQSVKHLIGVWVKGVLPLCTVFWPLWWSSCISQSPFICPFISPLAVPFRCLLNGLLPFFSRRGYCPLASIIERISWSLWIGVWKPFWLKTEWSESKEFKIHKVNETTQSQWKYIWKRSCFQKGNKTNQNLWSQPLEIFLSCRGW